MVLPNSFPKYLKQTESILSAEVSNENDEAGELADEWNDEVKVRSPPLVA